MLRLNNAVIAHLYKAADSRDILNAGIGAGIGAGGAALAGDKEKLTRNLILGALAGGASGAAYESALKPLAKSIFTTNDGNSSSVLTSAIGGAAVLPAIGAANDLITGRVRFSPSNMGIGGSSRSGSTFRSLIDSEDLKSIAGGADPVSLEHANRYVGALNSEQIRRRDEIISGKGGIRAKITSLMNKASPLKSFAERLALNQALSDMLNSPQVLSKILDDDAAYTPREIDQARAAHEAGLDEQTNKANRFRANARGLEQDLLSGKLIKKIDPDIISSIRANMAGGTTLEDVLKSLSSDPNLPEQYRHVDPLPNPRPAFDPSSMEPRQAGIVSKKFIEDLKNTNMSYTRGWGGRLGRLALLGGAGGVGLSLVENGIRKAVGA